MGIPTLKINLQIAETPSGHSFPRKWGRKYCAVVWGEKEILNLFLIRNHLGETLQKELQNHTSSEGQF